MHTRPVRILLIALVFAVALGVALLVLQQRDDTQQAAGDAPKRSSERDPAVTSSIWAVGDEWTVNVRQDAGAITPDGDRSIATVPYRFEVTDAPTDAQGTWRVHVTQDGAEGPFAAGWWLAYRADGEELVLHRVSVGEEPPLEAELAAIVLGPQFPYEVRYAAPPTNSTVDAAKLLERTSLPPSALPGQAADEPAGAVPPAQAPRLDSAGESANPPS